MSLLFLHLVLGIGALGLGATYLFMNSTQVLKSANLLFGATALSGFFVLDTSVAQVCARIGLYSVFMIVPNVLYYRRKEQYAENTK